MTWGYWGIVTGLLVLLGIFFACMEILYARAKNGRDGRMGAPTEGGGSAAKDNKHAA
jgi:hypothetical protein